MAFCTKCGNAMTDSAIFCPSCGTPAAQADARQESGNSTLVLKYNKNIAFLLLTEPLEVVLDGNLKFKVIEGREAVCNVAPGNHTLSAHVPYLGGSKYGAVTKSFYIGSNETLEILYKPPMAIFMTGNISIRKLR